MSQEINRRQLLLAGAAVSVASATVGADASPRWVDRGSFGPFQCRATFPLAPLAPVFGDVAKIERDLQRTLGLPSVSTPISVFVLADQRSHREWLRRIYPTVPYRRALYVRRGRQASVHAYRHKDLAVDLRHECTHALLHANLSVVPLWLDEGIAEYFEPPEPQRAFHNPHLTRLKWDLRFGWVRTIKELESNKRLDQMGLREYRSSWAWVHFMLHGPAAAHATLVEYVNDIRRWEPVGRLSDRLEARIAHLDSRMHQHFRQCRAA